MDNLTIDIKEGVEGMWRYHIAEVDKFTALCEARVMHSNMVLEDWGIPCANTEIRYKWCKKYVQWKNGHYVSVLGSLKRD